MNNLGKRLKERREQLKYSLKEVSVKNGDYRFPTLQNRKWSVPLSGRRPKTARNAV